MRSLGLAIAGLGALAPAYAVRINADGHGQALIYPYYTARSNVAGNAFVTAIAITNFAPAPKAVKVRFLENKAGAEVYDFNLFLAAYDVWTAGIVGTGVGAAIFSADNSCMVPKISSSASAPTRFRNAAYAGDLLGDGLDRTYEGYFEVLEMGSIDPESPLGLAVKHDAYLSAPNASKPYCGGLPMTDALPTALTKPTGGLSGNASLISVNEGTDYSVDAIALSQWSDKVQWGAVGNAHPNLADASPASSYVVDAREDGDIAYVSNWNSGRDAVTALFMVNRVRNDFSVEPQIKSATDWVLTLPTKRFYVNAARSDAPFGGAMFGVPRSANYACELISTSSCFGVDAYYDREAQTDGCMAFPPANGEEDQLCGATSTMTYSGNSGIASKSRVFASESVGNVALKSGWINGWHDFPARSIISGPGTATEVSLLIAPAGATTIIDTVTGQVTVGATVTHFGLPIVGFAAQSYSTSGLPGVNRNVLSNYGGVFNHKYTRRIEVQP